MERHSDFDHLYNSGHTQSCLEPSQKIDTTQEIEESLKKSIIDKRFSGHQKEKLSLNLGLIAVDDLGKRENKIRINQDDIIKESLLDSSQHFISCSTPRISEKDKGDQLTFGLDATKNL